MLDNSLTDQLASRVKGWATSIGISQKELATLLDIDPGNLSGRDLISIDDGFLAPYRVHRVITEWDAAGWRPNAGEHDRYHRPIPDEEYETKDFERAVALRARTEAIARHLTEFLKKTDRFAKTIVFCVDQEHADEMRRALVNLNSDLVQQHPDFACRVTADEGAIGRGHMAKFQDVETKTPAILTTSQLLTTGLNAPTCENVVVQAAKAKARGYRSSHNLKAMVYLVAGKLEMLPFT